MNHDIMHCHGFATKIEDSRIAIDESKPCPERESCYRYIAHLDAKAQGMKLAYSGGCMSYSLTVDGKEVADMKKEEVAAILITLLKSGYLPDTADMQSMLESIAETRGYLTDSGHCEQCGDNYYTYELTTPSFR